jgi:hypothetical protein
MNTEPKVTKEQVVSWCPEPRGLQAPGCHAEIPAMSGENANSAGKFEENRRLGDRLLETFRAAKPGGRFVLQWRMFPKRPDGSTQDSCGCGCSCGCG